MDLRVANLHIRYRWSEGADYRERFQKVLRMMIDGPLEQALARAGFTGTEIICVRSIQSSVRTHAGATDGAIAEAWAESIARQIRFQADHLDVRNGALRDVTAHQVDHVEPYLPPAAAAAVSPRQGAHRWEDEDTAFVSYRSRRAALLDMAVSIARGDLSRVWAWRQADLWSAPGTADLAEAGLQLVTALLDEPSAIAAIISAVDEIGLLGSLAHRIPQWQWLRLAQAAWKMAGYPAALRAGRPAEEPGSSSETVDAWLAGRAGHAKPLHGLTAEALEAIAVIVQLGQHARVSIGGSGPSYAIEDRPSRQPAEVSGEKTSHAITRRGGLLYLLNLFAARDWFRELDRDERLLARPARWVLHQLAMALADLPERDPAALAFCGLLSWQNPPSHSQPRPSMDEREVFARWRIRVRDELRLLLDPEARRDPDLVLASVLDRRARVEGDPGWIEVRFSLASVDLDVRRTGLDLDPGWLPAIGAVVRFVYE